MITNVMRQDKKEPTTGLVRSKFSYQKDEEPSFLMKGEWVERPGERGVLENKWKKHFHEEGMMCGFKMLLTGPVRWGLTIIFSNREAVSDSDRRIGWSSGVKACLEWFPIRMQ